MENQQMAMPNEMAPAGPNPEEMAIYDRMRQEISPQEFSNEMLAGASQIDPQAVAEFTAELQGLDMPPEALDALNDVVDEILANPEQYAQMRSEYIEAGVPEDILPEQFDPQFFAALNMAVDQMIAAPTGVQAFAEGGIAELKPIAQAIASYGRNGDTMLAHITPAEARMLRRRGGSGTINPDTGLPEFFIKKLWKETGGKVLKSVGKQLKSVGKAVKKFASSTVGRIVATVALGFFLGPAAASMLGATSAAGVAAVSGFVGSAGSTLLAGGNLKDALKAGAVGGLTAGAGAGIMGGSGAFQAGSYTGPTTIGGQFDKFTDAVGFGPARASGNLAPVVDAPAAVPGTGATPTGLGPNQMPVDPFDFGAPPEVSGGAPVPRKVGIDLAGNRVNPMGPPTGAPQPINPGPGYDPTNMAAASPGDFGAAVPGGNTQPGMFDSTKQFIRDNISPSGIREAGAQDALAAVQKQFPGVTPQQVMNAPANSVLGKAYQSAMPGPISTYGPAVAVGLGTLGAAGGFEQKQPGLTPEAQNMQDRLGREKQMLIDNPGMFTPKGFERFGAVYDDKGQITSWNAWTPESAGAFTQYQNRGAQVPTAGMASGLGSLMPSPVRMATGGAVGAGMTQAQVNQLVKEAAAQAGGSLSYADAANAAKNMGISSDMLKGALSTGLITGAPAAAAAPAAATTQSAYGPGSTAAALGASHIADGIQLIPGAPGYDPNKAAMRLAEISTYEKTPGAGAAATLKANNLYDTGMSQWQTELARLHQQDIDAKRVPAGTPVPGTPLYKGLTATSTPAQVAAAYRELAEKAGGDTAYNQREAVAYLQKLGIADPTIRAGYDLYLGRTPGGINPIASPSTPGGVNTFAPQTTPTAWNTMPNFTNYQAAMQGTPVVPTQSVLGGQVMGLTDPFSAGKTSPLRYLAPQPYNNAAMYGGVMSAKPPMMATGGIANLASGGYPRRNGQIEGPGTETSDEIPAMLSDGEFVMTAKAVRGAGGGSRRDGAKKMYALMHRLEKNATRG